MITFNEELEKVLVEFGDGNIHMRGGLTKADYGALYLDDQSGTYEVGTIFFPDLSSEDPLEKSKVTFIFKNIESIEAVMRVLSDIRFLMEYNDREINTTYSEVE